MTVDLQDVTWTTLDGMAPIVVLTKLARATGGHITVCCEPDCPAHLVLQRLGIPCEAA